MQMKNRLTNGFCLVLLFVRFCAAQGGAIPAVEGGVINAQGLPGQTWTAVGNLSPIEGGNVYTQSYIEQGAALLTSPSGHLTVTPYASLGLVLDTKGYKWNNKIEPRAGMKINCLFREGIISLGTAYSYENRFRSIESSGLILYAQDWFGWQSVASKNSRFPGSTWASIGNTSPVERGDVIAQAYVTQGVIAKRVHKFTVVPFAESTFSRDSKGFDWDNKAIYGGGVKTTVLRGDVYTEIGAAYREELRFHSGLRAADLTAFTNFSFGWNLLARRASK